MMAMVSLDFDIIDNEIVNEPHALIVSRILMLWRTRNEIGVA